MIYSFRYMQEEEENEYDDNFESLKFWNYFEGKKQSIGVSSFLQTWIVD